MPAFLVTLLIAVAMMVISYLIAPKPKQPKPEAAKQMEDPTAEAGKERPVIFGTITLKDPNCLWFGDKAMTTYQIKA
jgi:hypothetical protein